MIINNINSNIGYEIVKGRQPSPVIDAKVLNISLFHLLLAVYVHGVQCIPD